jgi:hypothetical protein
MTGCTKQTDYEDKPTKIVENCLPGNAQARLSVEEIRRASSLRIFWSEKERAYHSRYAGGISWYKEWQNSKNC